MTWPLSQTIVAGTWLADVDEFGVISLEGDALRVEIRSREAVASSSTLESYLLWAFQPAGPFLLTVERRDGELFLVSRDRQFREIARRGQPDDTMRLSAAHVTGHPNEVLLTYATMFSPNPSVACEAVDATTLRPTHPLVESDRQQIHGLAPSFGCLRHQEVLWGLGRDHLESLGSPRRNIPLQRGHHLMARSLGDLCFLTGLDGVIEVVSFATSSSHLIPIPSPEDFKEPVGLDVCRNGEGLRLFAAFRAKHSKERHAMTWDVALDGSQATVIS